MILKLNSLEVECVIGDRPDERVRAQRLLLDVELEVSSAAAVSDELADTVDYTEIAAQIRSALVEAKCMMIERAAKVAFDVCGPCARRVSVRKYGSFPGLESAEVVYEGR
jgi:FolB domain-containing protein